MVRILSGSEPGDSALCPGHLITLFSIRLEIEFELRLELFPFLLIRFICVNPW